MYHITYVALSAVLMFFLASCGGETEENPDLDVVDELHEHSVDEGGCEHMKEGPVITVSARAEAQDLQDVARPHTRSDIALVAVNDGNGGYVSFAADENGDYIFFLSNIIPFKVNDGSGLEIHIEETQEGIEHCSEVALKHTVHLKVGTYSLFFGPSELGIVSFVFEKSNHEHEQD